MSKPKAPETPDYAKIAKDQGVENRATSQQDWLNTLGTQSDAYKTTSTTKDPNSASGYRTDTTLNPADQARLDQQRDLMSQLLGVGGKTIGQVSDALGTKIDTSGLPALKGNVDYEAMKRAGVKGDTDVDTQMNLAGLQNLDDPTQLRQQASQRAYDAFSKRFEPIAGRQQEEERTRLANMGGVTTSDAARQQMSDLLQSQNDARTQGTFDAEKFGQDAAAQIQAQQLANRTQQYGERSDEFGAENKAVLDALGFNNQGAQIDNQNALANANLGNATRAQGLTEQQSMRQMALNELMAMLSGTQVQGGNFGQQQGTTTAAAPIFAGAQAQGAADQQTYAQQVGANNALVGALGSAAGGAAMM